jgi:hypothetical protein
MHLKAIEGAIAQLNNFAALELDHYSPEVIESDFYQFMQTATELSAADSHRELTPAAFLLLAKIAATSSTLHTLDLSYNSLGAALKGFSAAFGAACAAMPALHILNLSNNDLAGEDKAAITAPIEAHNYEIAKWSLADEFFAGFTGTGIEILGELSSVISDVLGVDLGVEIDLSI